MNLKGKVSVVTGASAGLGRVFARKLVNKGSRVYGLARRANRLSELQQELGDLFVPVVCDITNEYKVADFFDLLARDPGQADVLINNAGLGRYGRLESFPTEKWALQIDTNLTGVFFCTRAVIPIMKAQNNRTGFGGHIVNIASIAGLVGNPNLSVYNTTKFGLRGMSDALMKELRYDGIKVSCVSPGSVKTEFSLHSGGGTSRNPMNAEDIGDTVIHILEAPDNYLISEVILRPLRPRG